MKLRDLIATLFVLVPAVSGAQPAGPASAPAPAAAPVQSTDDGYCDWVKGQADATAATLYAPQLFGQFGYIEQPAFNETPAQDPSNLRLLAGVRYSLSNIYTGMLTTSRASAECRRHNAIAGLRGVSAGSAAAARVRVYEEHMAEANKLLQTAGADLEARRVTLQEANATQMRVEGLRSALADAKREMAAIPPQDASKPFAVLLSEYREADAAVERNEGKLRNAQAYDISVRVGMDRFLEGEQTGTRYFAVAQVGINLGAFFTGSGNSRAARGRRKYTGSGNDPVVASINATIDQMRALIEIDRERAAQAKTLLADLGQQLEMLERIGTDDSRRLRNTIWFDWVRAKADFAFYNASVEMMQQIVATHSTR